MISLDKKIAEQTAKNLFYINAVTLNLKQPYRYTSGILSPIYCDNRLIMSYPKIRDQIIDSYIKLIKKHIGLNNCDYLSGTATAAIPQTAFISYRLQKPMVYVEVIKGEKFKSKIRGKLPINKKVIIIEDLISTGGSSIANVLAIRKVGGKVKNCIAIMSYLMNKAKENFSNYKIKVFCLCTINDILDTAVKEGYIKIKEKAMIEQWLIDPLNWGKKYGFE